MSFRSKDIKLLWGRAAGMCSRPDCRRKLTAVGKDGESYFIGEMAHQIAQSPNGPRGGDKEGGDTYENLILLCPTHHREIDKSPDGTFPIELLANWKSEHETWVESWDSDLQFDDLQAMAFAVQKLMHSNKLIFNEFGPNSETAKNNPASTAYSIWTARKLDTILPNNRKLLNILIANEHLFDRDFDAVARLFEMHAKGFEDNQYERVENYPLFPQKFQDAIEELIK